MEQETNILTGLFVHDKKHGSYTAFFKELPESAAQGSTREEAEENLFKQLPMIIEVREEIENDGGFDASEESDEMDIFEKQYAIPR